MRKTMFLTFACCTLIVKWASTQCNFEQDIAFNSGGEFTEVPNIIWNPYSGYTGQWVSYEINDITVLADGTICGIGFRGEQLYPGDSNLEYEAILYRLDNAGNLLGISSFSSACYGSSCYTQKITRTADGDFLAIANNQLYCGNTSTSCLSEPWLGSVRKMLVQPDGSILFATYSSELFRYNEDITEDIAFNNNVSGLGISFIQDIDLLPNGKIILTGMNEIIRLNANGTLDTSFGNNGSVSISTTTKTNVAIQSTQKIVVLNYDYSIDQALSYRLNADGTPDNTFMNNTVYTGNGFSCDFNMITLATDDILISGNCGDSDFISGFITNLAADGINNSLISDKPTTGIALQSDGRLVAGGKNYYQGSYNFPWFYSYSAWINRYECNAPVHTENPQQEAANFSVFPIPAKEKLYIEFETEKQSLTLSISAIDGHILHKEITNAETGLNSKVLSLSTLPQGIYFLTINDGEHIKTKRFIKQ